jgi:hypothetical protein
MTEIDQATLKSIAAVGESILAELDECRADAHEIIAILDRIIASNESFRATFRRPGNPPNGRSD